MDIIEAHDYSTSVKPAPEWRWSDRHLAGQLAVSYVISMDIPEASDYSNTVKPASGCKRPTVIRSPFDWTFCGFVLSHMATLHVTCIRLFRKLRNVKAAK